MKAQIKLWVKSKDLIRSVTKKSDDYDETFMGIKFSRVDKLPLNKTIKILIITIVVRTVFMKIRNIIHKFFRWMSVWNISGKY